MSVDTTVKKVSGQASPHGEMDQTYLVTSGSAHRSRRVRWTFRTAE
jgi:hypothetical protein